MPFPLNIPTDSEDQHTFELEQKDIDAIIGLLDTIEDVNKPFKDNISFYEFSLARCCSIICQLTADKFQHTQKVLIKHIFSESNVRSLFASDLYMFILRIAHPNARKAMSKIIENLCKLAPPEANVKGTVLINRIKSAGLD